MVQIVLIGLGAGAASALLFASIASGSLLSILLFYLAPLPIMIAAIGWSHWAAMVAALAAALGLAAAFNIYFFLAFMIGIGLPAWWLGYLSLLARPDPVTGDAEWYPPGHLVVWAAIAAALIVIIAIPNFGLDEEQFRAGLRTAFERVMRDQTTAPAGVDSKRLVDFLVIVIPLAAAVLATVTTCINLYLAGRIVKVSGNLRRPWPVLSEMRFPAYAQIIAAAGLAVSFLPGLFGSVGAIVAASFMIAYAILGLAVLHAITRNTGGRSFILAGTYFAVVVIGWPALLMTMIGLADSVFDFRRRMGGPPSPPVAPSQ